MNIKIDINKAYHYYKTTLKKGHSLLPMDEFEEYFIQWLNQVQQNEMFDDLNGTTDIPYLLKDGTSKYFRINNIIKKINDTTF